ncbi:MAG: hypothetical protein JNN12_16560 [Bacteroidetes Order II. Incertae sedis bacterium]|nr:hypothetical protein [Bacteroidetes Order II. bacterium]
MRLIWVTIFGFTSFFGCGGDPSGRYGAYEGYYGGGYPSYFIPKDFPDERWMTEAPTSDTFKQRYRQLVETSILPEVQAMREENPQRAAEDLMMLGFSGGFLEITYRGMPGHKQEGGFGPQNTFDRVFTGKPFKMTRLVFPKKHEKWP